MARYCFDVPFQVLEAMVLIAYYDWLIDMETRLDSTICDSQTVLTLSLSAGAKEHQEERSVHSTDEYK